MQIFIKGKAEVTMVISDKVDFRTEQFTRDRKKHHIILRETIHQKRYCNPKCVHIKQLYYKICEANTHRIEKRNNQIHNYS